MTSVDWPVEEIPDGDTLFMRMHKDHFRNGKIQAGVFRAQGGGMSTDWSKYATPVQTLNRARIPEDNGVIGLPVQKVRAIPSLSVVHSPDIQTRNRAHTDVRGINENKTEARFHLRRVCFLELRPQYES